ncbi:hypothetical protein HK096_005836, partial [Nowakowskiella sp. JEL0078]
MSKTASASSLHKKIIRNANMKSLSKIDVNSSSQKNLKHESIKNTQPNIEKLSTENVFDYSQEKFESEAEGSNNFEKNTIDSDKIFEKSQADEKAVIIFKENSKTSIQSKSPSLLKDVSDEIKFSANHNLHECTKDVPLKTISVDQTSSTSSINSQEEKIFNNSEIDNASQNQNLQKVPQKVVSAGQIATLSMTELKKVDEADAIAMIQDAIFVNHLPSDTSINVNKNNGKTDIHHRSISETTPV